MSDDAVDVIVTLEPNADTDADERDRLARQLRTELLELDLDAITAAAGRDAPPGAKGAELAEWGVWLVTLSASGGVLTSLISVAKDWLNRRGSGHRIKLTVGDATIELDGASDAEQAAALEAFVQHIQCKRRPTRRRPTRRRPPRR
jgi:hypothetical protein